MCLYFGAKKNNSPTWECIHIVFDFKTQMYLNLPSILSFPPHSSQMGELAQRKILIIDCQTTGMHPSTGRLLQIGWSIFDPGKIESKIEKWTLKLDEEIPNKIRKMLQLSETDLIKSMEPRVIFNKLQKTLKKLGANPIVIAHYAQFEYSFLKHFYQEHTQTEQLNFQLFCSQKIAKRLLPNLPSHNLKAMAGYLKLENTPKNEIFSHIKMTRSIWQALIPLLRSQEVTDYKTLSQWLTQKALPKPSCYEYNINRLIRLEISSKPGIYRMLAQDRSVLYIGKATSLKTRVNSYFRGIKNRDRRKLEMLAQVWEIETMECDTPLEAALLESEEIKKWNPPYNVLLKADKRTLIFYNYDYTQSSKAWDNNFYNGPHRPDDSVSFLLELIDALKTKRDMPFFEEAIPYQKMQEAWILFCSLNSLGSLDVQSASLRHVFVIAYKLLNQFEKIHGKESFQSWWLQEKKKNLEKDLNDEEQLAKKLTRIFIRAAESLRKSKQIKRLYNSSHTICSTQKKITLVNGEFDPNPSLKKNNAFEVHHYDRLSILLSAKKNKLITKE